MEQYLWFHPASHPLGFYYPEPVHLFSPFPPPGLLWFAAECSIYSKAVTEGVSQEWADLGGRIAWWMDKAPRFSQLFHGTFQNLLLCLWQVRRGKKQDKIIEDKSHE